MNESTIIMNRKIAIRPRSRRHHSFCAAGALFRDGTAVAPLSFLFADGDFAFLHRMLRLRRPEVRTSGRTRPMHHSSHHSSHRGRTLAAVACAASFCKVVCPQYLRRFTTTTLGRRPTPKTTQVFDRKRSYVKPWKKGGHDFLKSANRSEFRGWTCVRLRPLGFTRR